MITIVAALLQRGVRARLVAEILIPPLIALAHLVYQVLHLGEPPRVAARRYTPVDLRGLDETFLSTHWTMREYFSESLSSLSN